MTAPELTLEQIVSRFPLTRLATPADATRLGAFHRAVKMRAGALELAYDLGSAALELGREAGTTSYCVLFEHEGVLYGTATFTLRRARIHGERVTYAYLSDLRISPRMPTALRREWKALYREILRRLPAVSGGDTPGFFLTAVLDGNERAVKLLTRHVPGVRYRPVQRYVSNLLFAPLPWSGRGDANALIRRATPSDHAAIRCLLAEGARRRGVGEDYTAEGPDELSRRLGCWEGFRLQDFYVAERSCGTLLAVLAPRSVRRKLLVNTPSRLLRAALRLARLMGVNPLPTPGSANLLYLTHLEVAPGLSEAEGEALLHRMLRRVYEEIVRPKGFHAMCFAAVPGHAWPIRRLKGWLKLTVPGTLYEVSQEQDAPSPVVDAAVRAGPFPLELAIS